MIRIWGLLTWFSLSLHVFADEKIAWPPSLPGAKDGTVTLKSKTFLNVPQSVQMARSEERSAPFVMAKMPPKVELAFHQQLGTMPAHRRLWSSWGDICVASDGRVYCAIGDHGKDVEGDARCFIYRWNPKTRTLKQIVKVNDVIPRQPNQPAWSKVHARIDESSDGKIYFNCTLNDGKRANQPNYHWNDKVPGGQIYQYDPKTGKTSIFANLPAKRCTATSILDRKRNIWWCNLEAKDAERLWGLDLKTKKVVYEAPAGSMGFNRAFALAHDGSIYFNGPEGWIWHCEPTKKKVTKTNSQFPNSVGMRSATRESKDGHIYGTTHRSNQLFRYTPAKDELKILGPNWLQGMYTTVSVLSPDERYLYYLPGAHGKAYRDGTPVMQYEIKTGQRKVLAFLAPTMEKQINYVPGGSYGVKMSTDGSTLYVNFNGHAADAIRPKHMRANGFGLCAFAAIHIPASER